jgi:DNA-binding response OmpR family regulator
MTSSKTILIVDDDPSILLSLDFLMKKAGYTVLVARDGDEALQLVSDNLPDAILLDIMMPGVDGYEVCKTVKSNPKWSHAKIIMLSAKSRDADIAKARELGADQYITKPFSTKNLLSEVNKLLYP